MPLRILVLFFVSKLRALAVLLVIISTTACSLMQLSIYSGTIAPGQSSAQLAGPKYWMIYSGGHYYLFNLQFVRHPMSNLMA
jgi:hypothetical protein